MVPSDERIAAVKQRLCRSASWRRSVDSWADSAALTLALIDDLLEERDLLRATIVRQEHALCRALAVQQETPDAGTLPEP